MERYELDRTPDQNRKFHAMVRDIANQMSWAGSRWSEEDWKRLFLGAKFGQPIVPSPFGHGICVMNAKRSRDLTAEQMAELIGEVEAFGNTNEVQWSEQDD
jgi:hypothetical protein